MFRPRHNVIQLAFTAASRLARTLAVLVAMAVSASAAPHTVSNVEHPFDPDWPDVWLILAQKCNACHRPGTDRVDLTSWEASTRRRPANA